MYATEAKANAAFMFLEVHLRKTDERILAWPSGCSGGEEINILYQFQLYGNNETSQDLLRPHFT